MSRLASEPTCSGVGEPCPDGLLCALSLDPTSLPRNRFFWVYTEPRARRVHGRARALRRLASELSSLLCSAPHTVHVSDVDRELRIAYRDPALAMRRRLVISAIEASLLRVLLSAQHTTTVPALLRASDADRARIEQALRRLGRHPELPPVQVPPAFAPGGGPEVGA